MGQTYDVHLTLIRDDDEKLIKLLNKAKLREEKSGTIFYDCPEGEYEDLEELVMVFLTEFDYESDGVNFSSGFDASYGWGDVLVNMFKEIAPALKDGSEIEIYPDNGRIRLWIENGKVLEEYDDEEDDE